MTERLYYTDPSCRTFDAIVTRALTHEGRAAVLLDRTAFYPTSGGQPYDTGRLDDTSVLDTVDADEGIVHVVSEPIPEGTRVHGVIDWDRRADHMQQHTGQHVLSAAFDRLFQNRTISFHMGADVSTIDLARELAAADVERAVDEANRIVWDDRPVTIRFATAEEAARLPLRKESVRQGTLRLIEVDDFDVSACGGTHVARTGAIGLIAVTAAERFKGGMRVSFACGARALRWMRTYRDAVAGSVRLLSVLPPDLPDAIARLQGDVKELRKTSGRLQDALAVHEAARLLGTADRANGPLILVQALEGWDAAGLKAIASALTAHPAVVAALFSTTTPALVVVARAAGVAADANAVVRKLIERFGGRGGGKPDLAQAGGLTGTREEMLAAARELIA